MWRYCLISKRAGSPKIEKAKDGRSVDRLSLGSCVSPFLCFGSDFLRVWWFPSRSLAERKLRFFFVQSPPSMYCPTLMKLSDLDFQFPEELIAIHRAPESRVMCVQNNQPTEITLDQLVEKFAPGDVLVLNDTKVLKRRVFAGLEEEFEVLFLGQKSDLVWEVLFPSKKLKIGDELVLPFGLSMKLVQKGRPQLVELSQKVDEAYFEKAGELPLPPYIQKARGQRHNLSEDEVSYQTAWAEKPGSFAAPTASFHFHQRHLDALKNRGVDICFVTLHVGLGTFLPVQAEDLDDHVMHGESCEIPAVTYQKLLTARQNKKRIWALGTTVSRTLESQPVGKLTLNQDGSFSGVTDLLIQPGFQFHWVDVLLTNFHQPKSTLLALVSAFSNLEKVKACYAWAISNKFRLFSYGDLSVWFKN